MARKIIWTLSAHEERKEILEYWAQRNKSKVISRKLNKLFLQALNDISKNPLIGRRTDIPNVRVKIIREYLLFYEVNRVSILVLSLWDGRRNPSTRKIK